MFSLQAADDLEAAAEEIEGLGWRQGGSYERNLGCCAGEAIVMAVPNFRPWTTKRRVEACDALLTYLGLPAGKPEKIILWNDHRDRTEAEVLDALRGAAKEIRNAH